MADSEVVSKVLKECSDKVELFIQLNIEEVASFLFKKDILSQPEYHDVINPQSMCRKDQNSKKIFRKLSMVVQLDEDVYEIFMQFLRSNSSRTYVKIVKVLDAEYKRHSGAAAGVLELDPSPQEAREEGTMS